MLCCATLLSIFCWGEASDALEVAIKVLAALETQPVGDFGNLVVGSVQFRFGDVDDFGLYVLDWRFAGLFFHQVAKIIGT